MTSIVVLVPVLARPQNAQPLVDSFRASNADARLLFILSPRDDAEIGSVTLTGADRLVAPFPPGHGDFARKINLGYRQTTEPFIFQAADDVEFQPGWDTAALAAIEAGPYGVCGTNDQANPQVMAGRHSTHTLFRRSYCDSPGASADGPGTVFSEAYSHQWVDNEAIALAASRGEWSFAFAAVVRHRHWIWRTAEMDATYARGSVDERADAQLFQQRRKLWEKAAG